MLFASPAPRATRKPIIMSVIGSSAPRNKAELEAMKRFDGPANGIRLNPKELRRTISRSTIGVNIGTLRFFLN